MSHDRPLVESRARRLLLYLKHNRGRIVADGALLLGWVLAATLIFDWLEQPTWVLYLVLFIGVVAYTRITPTWERPYRSPD
ncbi:hypothetical protein [Natronolimnobius baerhuensis]|uniref:DUF8119 domain-containing protein n=1 Tax=Natronolimnobius baerhuensis TaxID=253108 RepID=A0A202E6T3_9EURY|nr:hypothetical protein [Natronolimnobius baerhuensis]OVE83971.1 hypothetical protein B2G88_16335 [Natronolimnobius baerhuensis]